MKRSSFLAGAAAIGLIAGLAAPTPAAAVVIGLSSLADLPTPIGAIAGTPVASITSSTEGSFFVKANSGAAAAFATLGAFVLNNSNFDGSSLTITFNTVETGFAASFATADLGAPSALTLTAFRSGVAVGMSTATGKPFLFDEGVIGFDAASFDRIVLADSGAPAFAIGNIQVAEPASVLLLAAGLGLVGWSRGRRRLLAAPLATILLAGAALPAAA